MASANTEAASHKSGQWPRDWRDCRGQKVTEEGAQPPSQGSHQEPAAAATDVLNSFHPAASKEPFGLSTGHDVIA